MNFNRRDFVAGGIGATTALSFGPSLDAKVLGANEQLRVAVIGFGGRGRALINCVKRAKNAKLVALCDADDKILKKQDAKDQSLFRTQNFREILDRKDIDAIASATPNHWHSLLTILAVQAGKHVYIEKPISHNMLESQEVVKAARKYKRIVQCGFQNRSDTGLIPFYQKLKAGDYGKVLFVHGTCHRSRNSIGKLEKPLTVPKHIDYNFWLGPAAKQPIMRPRFHYDWHWDFNTGNGDVGNQGPHEWDLMNWALGDPDDLPSEMIAAGNRFGWNDAGNTPNIMACAGISNGIPFCFEVMDLKGGRRAPYNRGVGVIIKTERGVFVGGRGGGQFRFSDGKQERFRRTGGQGDGTQSHMENFVQAIQENNRKIQRSECAVAANSAAMSHMANLSYQLAAKAKIDQVENSFDDNVNQRDMIGRLRDSTWLFAASKGGAPQEPWMLGPKLSYDNKSKKFTGDNANKANALIGREYRKGFELPKS